MDRNSIIGLLLIGAIMILFTIVNQPDREALELAKIEQASKDSLDRLNKLNSIKFEEANIDSSEYELSDSLVNIKLANKYGDFNLAAKGENETINLTSSLHSFSFNSKGGQLKQIALNNFKSLDKTDLLMFEADSSSFSFSLPIGNKTVSTGDLFFKFIQEPNFDSDSSKLILRSQLNESEWIDFIYTFHKDSYMVGFTADFSRIATKINQSTKDIEINWSAIGRRQEKNL